MSKIIKEVLDLIPLRLKSYGKVHDSEIFSNERIESYVISSIITKSSTKPISKKIIEGIKKKNIIIGYNDKSKLNFIKRRWFQKNLSDNGIVMGYFSALDNKLIILLDHNVNIFGHALRDIPPILIHELCHVAASQKNTSFLLKTKDFMKKYLTILISNIFNEKYVKPNLLLNTISELYYTFDRYGDSGLPAIFDSAYTLWLDYFSKTYGDPDLLTNTFLIPYKAYYKGFKVDSSSLKNITMMYNLAYQSMGIQNTKLYTLVGQEPVFLSEIISVSNQLKLTPEIASVINDIRWG